MLGFLAVISTFVLLALLVNSNFHRKVEKDSLFLFNGDPDFLLFLVILPGDTQNGMTSRVTARTNSPERLEDQSRELLLYDPQDLARASLIDDLPGTVTIDEAGQPAPGGAGAYFLLPALTLLGNGWYVYRHWIA